MGFSQIIHKKTQAAGMSGLLGRMCAFLAVGILAWCPANNLHAQEMGGKVIERVDSDPELTRSLGQDRLSKYLILAPDATDRMSRINKSFLAEMVDISMDDDVAFKTIGKDLARGDVKLRDAISNALSVSGLPPEESSRLILSWANTGGTPAIKAAMRRFSGNPTALAKMAEYHLSVDDVWIRSLEGMSQIVEGKSPIESRVLISTLVYSGAYSELNAQKAAEALQRGSVEGRWFLAMGVERIVGGHSTVARHLSESPLPSNTWNQIVWARVAKKIASDPTLTAEYTHRLLRAAPLFEEMRELLAESIETNGSAFITGYLEASLVSRSRFEALIKDEANLKDFKIDTSTAAVSELIKKLPKKIRENDYVVNHLLWHLSRSGESTALAIRKAAPTVLEENPDLCATLIAMRLPPAEPFEHAIAEAGAYNYQKGSIKKKTDEDIKSGTLLHYARKVGAVISQDSSAWLSLVGSNDEKAKNYFRELVIGATYSDPSVSFAWLYNILKEDPYFSGKFEEYILGQKLVSDDKAYDKWLEAVKSAIQSGDDLGNDDAANFKGWLADFMRTKEGWTAAKFRIDIETVLIPERLRESMAITLLDDPKRMWRIYDITTASYGSVRASFLNSIDNFARRNALGKLLLDQVVSGNKKAAEASGQLWPYVLAKEQPTIIRYRDLVIKNKVPPDLERLHMIAFSAALRDPKAWAQVRKDAAALMKIGMDKVDSSRDYIVEQYEKKSTESIIFSRKAMENSVFQESWRIRVLNTVRFLGETRGIARLIAGDEGSLQSWNAAAFLSIQKYPSLVEDILKSLLVGGESDEWFAKVNRIQKDFVRMILEERLLFEQFIGSRNREFFNAFAQKMGQSIP